MRRVWPLVRVVVREAVLWNGSLLGVGGGLLARPWRGLSGSLARVHGQCVSCCRERAFRTRQLEPHAVSTVFPNSGWLCQALRRCGPLLLAPGTGPAGARAVRFGVRPSELGPLGRCFLINRPSYRYEMSLLLVMMLFEVHFT